MTAALDAGARAAIADVLALYCHAIDRRRWALLEACFHDDAIYTFASMDGPWRTFVPAAQRLVGALPMTHHQLGQTSHAVDGAKVRTETYFTATHHVPADAPRDAVFAGRGQAYHRVIAGRYVDVFTCRDGRWRIARRVGVIDARHDVTPAGDPLAIVGTDDPAFVLHG